MGLRERLTEVVDDYLIYGAEGPYVENNGGAGDELVQQSLAAVAAWLREEAVKELHGGREAHWALTRLADSITGSTDAD